MLEAKIKCFVDGMEIPLSCDSFCITHPQNVLPLTTGPYIEMS